MTQEESTLGVVSWIDPETGVRFVRESYQSAESLLTPDEARVRASELYRAAGLAEACAGFVKLYVLDNLKGFDARTLEKTAKLATNAVGVLMKEVAPLPEDIGLGYGFRFLKRECIPIVRLTWGIAEGITELDLSLDSCRNHALSLFAAAEAVQTDRFLHHFLSSEIALELDEVQILLGKLGLFRDQDRLEDLLGVV